MAVKVLGPLDIGTGSLSPRERAILAALIVRQGAAMAPAELAEAYWGETVPQTWAQQIRTSVARIRGRLGKDAVTTSGSEYSLGIEPDVIDAVRFERLVSTARQHSLHGEPERAVDAYRRGLGLWRGTPYPDLADWEPGVVEAMRLDEIRHSAEEELLDARLQAGEHRALIPEAERLVREAPMREDRWAILALANYRAGRQADALAVLRAARERLLDDLGIEPGARLAELETAILRQDPAISPVRSSSQVSVDCPYRGLAAYGPAEADEFFGRDGDIEEILARMLPGTVTAIAGPSGSGKSSVMLAGVIPRLIQRGRRVETLRPGSGTGALLRHYATTDAGIDVIAIDQAEEILRAEASEIEAFCAAIAQFVGNDGAAVLTIRSDFLDELVALPEIGAAIGRGPYLLGPLSRSAMRDAISEPARLAGLRLEPGLVEVLLRDASGRSATLPPLSHALQETWVRREGSTLTVDGYEAAGGIAGAIAQSSEALYQSLDERGRTLYRSTMLRLVDRREDGTSVSRRTVLAPLLVDPQRRAIIETLVGTRLAVIDADTLAVAHEAIATAWPRLDAWLEEDASGARIARHLEGAAEAWVASARSEDELLRGARLHSALEWREESHPDLTEDEDAFLEASEEREQSEMRDIAARAARDRANNRRLRWALTGVAGLLVVALVSGGVAVVTARQAAASAEDAQIEAVTARALDLTDTNRDIAALIAAEAYRRWPNDPRAHAALMSSMTEANGYVETVAVPDTLWRMGAWPIPGTTTVLLVRDQHRVDVMDYRTGEILRALDVTLSKPDQIIRPWVRVSEDASTGVIVQHLTNDPEAPEDDSEEVTFVDLESGNSFAGPIPVDNVAETVSLSSDGRYATWATLGDLTVVDRDTGEVRTIRGAASTDPATPTAAASVFDPAGFLYYSHMDGTVKVIDPHSLTVVRNIQLPAGYAGAGIVVTADGAIFSLGSRGVLASTSDGTVLWQRSEQRRWECSRIAASSEADIAICGDETGGVERWRLSTGQRMALPFDYHLSAAGDLAFADDHREVLFLSAIAPSIGRIRIDGSGPGVTAFGAGMAASFEGGLSPSGEYIILEPSGPLEADAAGQREYAIWDIESDVPVFRIPGDLESPFDGELEEPIWLTEDRIGFVGVRKSIDADGNPEEWVGPVTLDIGRGEIVEGGFPRDIADMMDSAQPDTVFVLWEDGTTRTLDTRTMEMGDVVFRTPTRPFAIADNADGSRVVAVVFERGSPTPLTSYLFDGTSGELLAEGLDAQHAVAVSRTGEVIAGDNTRVAQFSGEDLGLTQSIPNLTGGESLAIDGSGHTLLVNASSAAGASIVDIPTRRRLGDAIPVMGPGSIWLAVDASAIYLPSNDGMVKWSLDADEHFAAACQIAGRELTDAEWSTFLAMLGPRVDTCADVLG